MEKKEHVGYPVDMELSKYEVRFWADGDCMDSPDAPIRIKNGQRILAHKYDGVFNPYGDIESVKGKVCCILYIAQGKRFGVVKEVMGIDELTGTLRLKFYYPQVTIVLLKIDAIEEVYIVDGVEE